MRRIFRISFFYGRNGLEKDIYLVEENGLILKKTSMLGEAGSYDELYELDGIVMPSFVNAHTHLELTNDKSHERFYTPDPTSGENTRAKQSSPVDLWDWILDVIALKRSFSEEEYKKNILAGEKMNIENKTGVVGDVRSVLPEKPCFYSNRMHGTVFFEVLGYEEKLLSEKLRAADAFLTKSGNDPKGAHRGISVHSLYTTPFSKCREILAFARSQRTRTMIHMGETAYESKLFFERETAGFHRIFPSAEPERHTFHCYADIIRYLELDYTSMLVHCVEFSPQDWDEVKKCNAGVIFCPRSNRAMSGKLPQIRTVIQKGIRWAIGTDSLVTTEDLDVLKDAVEISEYLDYTCDDDILFALTYGGRDVLGVDEDGLSSGDRAGFIFIPVRINDTRGIIRTIAENRKRLLYSDSEEEYGSFSAFKK